VVVYPFIGCGKCAQCTDRDQDHLCFKRALGFVADGGFSTHLLVPDFKYLFRIGRIPPQVRFPTPVARATFLPSKLSTHRRFGPRSIRLRP